MPEANRQTLTQCIKTGQCSGSHNTPWILAGALLGETGDAACTRWCTGRGGDVHWGSVTPQNCNFAKVQITPHIKSCYILLNAEFKVESWFVGSKKNKSWAKFIMGQFHPSQPDANTNLLLKKIWSSRLCIESPFFSCINQTTETNHEYK